MAFARVVGFDGVTRERLDELKARMEEGSPPEGFPPAEMLVLYDGDSETSLVVLVFETEDDYETADGILSAMPSDETPGQRTAVSKYEVALRMKQ